MADGYLVETSLVDRFLLEDGSGVYELDTNTDVVWNGTGLTNGSAITNGAAGPGDTPLSVFGVGTHAYEASTGLVVTTLSGTGGALFWTTTGRSARRFRGYFEVPATPAAATFSAGGLGPGTATTFRFSIGGPTSVGEVRIFNSANTLVYTIPAGTLTAGTLYRYEYAVDQAAGTARMWWWTTTGTQVADTGVITSDFGTTHDRVSSGTTSGSGSVTFRHGFFAATDTPSVEIGPATLPGGTTTVTGTRATSWAVRSSLVGTRATSWNVSGPPVYLSSTFTQADGALGSSWAAVGAGPPTVVSNAVVGGSAISIGVRYTTPTSTDNQWSQITYRGGSHDGVAVAMPAFADGVAPGSTGAGWYIFRQQAAGAGTSLSDKSPTNTLLSLAGGGPNLVAGDVIRLEYNNGVLTAFINGVQVLTATPVSAYTGRYVGFSNGNTTNNGVTILDDWSGGDMGAAPSLTRVTGTRATTWATRAPVAGTRSTTWATRATVVGTRGTAWPVRQRVTGTRSTTWPLRNRVVGTRSTTWATRAPVTGTRTTTWAVRAPRTGTRGTAWSVRGSLVGTRSTTWATRAARTGTRGTSWAVRATAAGTRATAWAVRAPLAGSRAATWAVRSARTGTRATTWGVIQRLSGTRTTTWGIGGTVTGTRSTAWSVRASGTGTRATAWAVRVSAGAGTRSTSWVTRQQVLGTRSTAWATRTVVTGTRGTAWSVRSARLGTRSTSWQARMRVLGSRGTSWALRRALSGSRSATWAVRNARTGTRATTWATRGYVVGSRVTVWEVQSTIPVTEVVGSRSTTWSVRQVRTGTRSATYIVRGRRTGTRATAWDTRQRVTGTRAATWAVRRPLTGTRSTTYAVRVTRSATRSTGWATYARTTGTRATGWGVRSSLEGTRATTWGTRQNRTGVRSTVWGVRQRNVNSRNTTWGVQSRMVDTRATSWKVQGLAGIHDVNVDGAVGDGSGGTLVMARRSIRMGSGATVRTHRATSGAGLGTGSYVRISR